MATECVPRGRIYWRDRFLQKENRVYRWVSVTSFTTRSVGEKAQKEETPSEGVFGGEICLDPQNREPESRPRKKVRVSSLQELALEAEDVVELQGLKRG